MYTHINKSSNFILATLRIAGSLQKSTEVMKAMQQLIKIPEVAATMRDLSKEMMKVCKFNSWLHNKFIQIFFTGWNY